MIFKRSHPNITRQGKSTLSGKSLDKLYNFFVIIVDLGQEAHAIRSHAPLPLDENFGDTRQMLARMAILSNEMLISVELHLSRALMSKRLELKVKSIFFGVVLNQLKNLFDQSQAHIQSIQ